MSPSESGPRPASGAWRESDSEAYRAVASVAVPDREHQLATLLCLVPFEPDETFGAIDLGCGEGPLAAALLSCFPRASVLALDGSSSMRHLARATLAPFGQRAVVAPFDLFSPEMSSSLNGSDCVLSSLVLHHLDAPAKRHFFDAAYARLSLRGALLIADLVEPQRQEARALFAEIWDQEARGRSQELFGSDEAFDEFVAAEWNWFRWPDPIDVPSPLADQLTWLTESGFASVDCFWMRAGHAIYGGYGPEAAEPKTPLSFERALEAAREFLV
jgi:tRNA (cmo5U34)-methyltransferase